MIIKSVELNNFGVYKGLNRIDLSVDDSKNIVVISGKNGYGKTTFLTALVWCLYGRQMGDVDEMYKGEINRSGQYEKYIKNSLNRQAERRGKTTFSVAIVFLNVDVIPNANCRELKVTRTYHTKGDSAEELEILINGDQSELVDEIGKEIFIRDFIMPKELAKFFFFDAEKIASLAAVYTARQRAELNDAYCAVLRIKPYRDLRDDLESYLHRLKSEAADKSERERLKRLRTEWEIANAGIEELKSRIAVLSDEASEIKFESDRLQEELIRKGCFMTVGDLHELRDRKKALEKRLRELNAELKSHYETIPFAMAGDLLTEVLVQVIRERALINRGFDEGKIEQLSDDIIDELISLPRPADIVIRPRVQQYYVDGIRRLLTKHLGWDAKSHAECAERWHDFSESEETGLKALIDVVKRDFKAAFKGINAEYNRCKNELNAMDRRIKSAEEKTEDPLVKADRERKDRLDEAYAEKQRAIGALDREIKDKNDVIRSCHKGITEITKGLKSAREREEISGQVERTIKYLKGFIAAFKSEKSHSLSRRIKENLDALLHKSALISDVKVEMIGRAIEIDLLDSRGLPLDKSALSRGEQQMYGTALLKGLIDESHIEFPVFIDSPMQKFDATHAGRVVQYFYPRVSNQVILFPLLEKELTRDEFDSLSTHISRSYLIRHGADESSSFEAVGRGEALFGAFEKAPQYAV